MLSLSSEHVNRGSPGRDSSCHQTWWGGASRSLPNSIQGVEVGDEDHTSGHQQHSPLTSGEHPYAASEHHQQAA